MLEFAINMFKANGAWLNHVTSIIFGSQAILDIGNSRNIATHNSKMGIVCGGGGGGSRG